MFSFAGIYMKQHNFFVLIALHLFLILAAYGCERDINLDLDDTEPKLVVDASIESNSAPLVVLSRSLNYFNTLSTDALSNSFERDARIVIYNDNDSVILKEYSITNDSGYTFHYYTCDLSRPGEIMLGKKGSSYTLNIQTKDGNSYTATTTIPLLRKTCDSLWWQPSPDAEDTTLVVLYGLFSDPPGFGDYVRYFTSTNQEPFYPGYTSAFDDRVVDGTTYTFQIPKGFDRNDTLDLNNENFGFFEHGDTVMVKFTNIDLASYDFWRTWEYAYQSNGNPFSSPIKVLGNVSNGALGAFCGYAAQFREIIIPE